MPTIQQISPKNDWIGPALQAFQSQLEQQKQDKLKQAQALIASGNYQPVQGGQQPGLLGGMKQNMMGPDVGGQNMNVMGQNYQFNSNPMTADKIDLVLKQKQLQDAMKTPEQKAQDAMAEMNAMKSGLGQNQTASVNSDGAVQVTNPSQLDTQSKQADINRKEADIKSLQTNQTLDAKSKSLAIQKAALQLKQLQASPSEKATAMQDVVNKVSNGNPQQQFTSDFTMDLGNGLKVTMKPKDSNIGGLDFSQSPEDVQSQAKRSMPGLYKFGEQVKNGDMKLKDIPGYGKNAQNKLMIDQYFASAYPGVNPDLRAKTKQDYSPGGPIGKQLTSAGTIVQHMYELKKTIKDLDAKGFVPWNMGAQTFSRVTGAGQLGAIKKYDLLKNLLSSEYETYLRNGASAEPGIERIISTMNEADPPDVQRQVLDEGASAMAGRLGNYVSGWHDQFNRPDDPQLPTTVLNSKTREALKEMGMDDVIKSVESPRGMAGVDEGIKDTESTSDNNNDPLGIR